MSEIVIKGMEMPKKCLGSLTGVGDCFIVGKCKTFQNTDLDTKDKIAWDDRLPNCPLVELPPHGRLGDLDKTRKQIEDSIETVAKSKGFVDGGELWKIVNKCFDEAPTVLEASE